jgi:hypothetical protein
MTYSLQKEVKVETFDARSTSIGKELAGKGNYRGQRFIKRSVANPVI